MSILLHVSLWNLFFKDKELFAAQISPHSLSGGFLASEIIRNLMSADAAAGTKGLHNNLVLRSAGDAFPFLYISIYLSHYATVRFSVTGPQSPIPLTEGIWIHPGTLLQATPLNWLRLQHPGNQVSSKPVQKKWRQPPTPMPPLASNQTFSSETQIPLTDHGVYYKAQHSQEDINLYFLPKQHNVLLECSLNRDWENT